MRKNYRKAFPLLMEAAQSGHVHCMNLIGYSYDNDLVFRRISRQPFIGMSRQQSMTIGLLFTISPYVMTKGDGVQADPGKAFSLYQQSAMLGDLPSACNLGVMFIDGCGTEQDLAAGIWWLRWAARKGEAKAQYNMGRAYSYGEGVPKNRRRALAWLGKAAEQGNKIGDRTHG